MTRFFRSNSPEYDAARGSTAEYDAARSEAPAGTPARTPARTPAETQTRTPRRSAEHTPRHTPRHSARDVAHIAVFAALIAALGVPGTLYIGGSGVPITLQTMGVMLAGAILGPWKGLASAAVFDVLTFAGLPLLAGGRGGPAFFTVQPTAGYAWGFMLGALVVGLLTRVILPRYPLWLGIVVTAVGGMVAVYAVGIPWMAAATGTPLWAAFTGNFIYFPGDAIKVVATAMVAKQVHRAYPGLIRGVRRRTRADARSAAGDPSAGTDARAGTDTRAGTDASAGNSAAP